MDVRRRLWRWAFARPHAFVLAWPGATPVRLAAEAYLRRAGWPLAQSPADTDILLVAGPVPDGLVEQVWRGVPAPRARVLVDDPSAVPDALRAARDELADAVEPAISPHRDHAEAAPIDHGAMDHGDMHGMDMPMPAGLPLAGEAADRDGLDLDELHVAFGPALPYWPAGLRLALTIQGDVVTEAQVEAPRLTGAWQAPGTAARRLDSLHRLFAVAGADALALHAARIRDEIVAGETPTVARLVSRARHDPVLRSMTGRIPVDPDGTLLGLPVPGDVAARWQRWLDELEDAVAGRPVAAEPYAGVLLDAMPGLVTGRELAEVRLIVAALDPDLDQLAYAHA